MTELIYNLLYIALIGLILLPIVGVLGCTLINAYFNRMKQHQIEMASIMMAAKVGQKKEDKTNA